MEFTELSENELRSQVKAGIKNLEGQLFSARIVIAMNCGPEKDQTEVRRAQEEQIRRMERGIANLRKTFAKILEVPPAKEKPNDVADTLKE